jgi:hypothetical protein
MQSPISQQKLTTISSQAVQAPTTGGPETPDVHIREDDLTLSHFARPLLSAHFPVAFLTHLTPLNVLGIRYSIAPANEKNDWESPYPSWAATAAYLVFICLFQDRYSYLFLSLLGRALLNTGLSAQHSKALRHLVFSFGDAAFLSWAFSVRLSSGKARERTRLRNYSPCCATSVLP